MYIFTVRNEVAKVMFLHMSVCPQGGVPGQVPPGTRYTPPHRDQVHTPWDQVHPPGTRYTPLGSGIPPGPGTPPRTRYTPWDQDDCVFYSYCQRRVLGSRGLLVVYVLTSYQTLQVVPHGTKGTGPRFVTRPAYLRSQFRNNTNTVSTLVPLIPLVPLVPLILLFYSCSIYYRFSVHGTRVSHITGRSRPLGEVGLTPRQYTEWNVVGRARSTGGPSQ